MIKMILSKKFKFFIFCLFPTLDLFLLLSKSTLYQRMLHIATFIRIKTAIFSKFTHAKNSRSKSRYFSSHFYLTQHRSTTGRQCDAQLMLNVLCYLLSSAFDASSFSPNWDEPRKNWTNNRQTNINLISTYCSL